MEGTAGWGMNGFAWAGPRGPLRPRPRAGGREQAVGKGTVMRLTSGINSAESVPSTHDGDDNRSLKNNLCTSALGFVWRMRAGFVESLH